MAIVEVKKCDEWKASLFDVSPMELWTHDEEKKHNQSNENETAEKWRIVKDVI